MDVTKALLLILTAAVVMWVLLPVMVSIGGGIAAIRTGSPRFLLFAVAPVLFFFIYNGTGVMWQAGHMRMVRDLPRSPVVGRQFSELVSFGPVSDEDTMVLRVKYGIEKVTVVRDFENAGAKGQRASVQTVSGSCLHIAYKFADDFEHYVNPRHVRRAWPTDDRKMFEIDHNSPPCVTRSALFSFTLRKSAKSLYLYQDAATAFGPKHGVVKRQYALYVLKGDELVLADYQDDTRADLIYPYCLPLFDEMCQIFKTGEYARPEILRFLDSNLTKRQPPISVF